MNFDLLLTIDADCQNTIRAVSYYRSLDGGDLVQLIFIRNALAQTAITSWCKTFGSTREKSHYKNICLYCEPNLQVEAVNRLTVDEVRSRLSGSACFTPEEYEKFWEATKNARDQFFVHNDYAESNRPAFPDLEALFAIACEMRVIIKEIATLLINEDNFRGNDSLVTLVEQHGIPAFLAQLELEAYGLRKIANL